MTVLSPLISLLMKAIFRVLLRVLGVLCQSGDCGVDIPASQFESGPFRWGSLLVACVCLLSCCLDIVLRPCWNSALLAGG